MLDNQNFSMYAGDTKILIAKVTDENNAPLTLTDCTAKWVLKKSVSAVDNLVLKTTEITFSGDEVHIKLNSADTKTLEGIYYHECEIMDSSGNVSTIFSGKVNIVKTSL